MRQANRALARLALTGAVIGGACLAANLGRAPHSAPRLERMTISGRPIHVTAISKVRGAKSTFDRDLAEVLTTQER